MTKTKDIRKAVEDELLFDPRVDSSDIRVQNMGGDQRAQPSGSGAAAGRLP